MNATVNKTVHNNIKVKLGTYGAWHEVTTLELLPDGSFNICWGQDWTFYPTTATVQFTMDYRGRVYTHKASNIKTKTLINSLNKGA